MGSRVQSGELVVQNDFGAQFCSEPSKKCHLFELARKNIDFIKSSNSNLVKRNGFKIIRINDDTLMVIRNNNGKEETYWVYTSHQCVISIVEDLGRFLPLTGNLISIILEGLSF